MKTIPLTDSRLAAIATNSLDDEVLIGGGIKPIPIPSPVISDNALSLRRDGNRAWFTVGIFKKEPVEVSVHIENGDLVFFPQRSAAHRELLKALGEGD